MIWTLASKLTRALALMGLVWAAPAQADAPVWAPRDQARVYFFGNSLIHHLTGSDTTTVPHWLALMAKAAGKDFAADGRWGFPRDFAAQLPPIANWEFRSVRRAWDQWKQPFRAARFDTVVLTPENFIQYDPVDRPYLGANPDGSTPLQATLKVVDWVQANADRPRFLIYEGWADLHPFTRVFPPSAAELVQYYDHAGTRYHDWFRAYVERLRQERPGVAVGLIPVGSIMTRLLTGDLLRDLEPQALYSDRSPHGTATTYLLAAMITYAALYGTAPPSGLALPDVIDSRFAARYDRIAAAIGAEIAGRRSD